MDVALEGLEFVVLDVRYGQRIFPDRNFALILAAKVRSGF